MTTTTITAELLDALLSADSQRRREAEEFYQAIPVNDRVFGLLPFLQQQQPSSSQQHLAAVLLRRNILRLTDIQAVKSLVDPLLGSFLTTANNSNNARIAIGHSLAEICGTVALLSPSPQDKEQVMTRILNAISGAVAQGDVPSLRLLAAMAERAPGIFARTAASSLESLTKQIIAIPGLMNTPSKDAILESLMQVLVQAAISTQQQEQSQSGDAHTTTTAILPFLGSNQLDNIKVDPASPAAALGRTCLPLLAPYLAGPAMLNILQEWTQAATYCPSFLAGDKSVLELILHTCLNLAYHNHQNNDDDSRATIALAALEVISSLCAVGDVKRKILAQDPALCQTILQGGRQPQGGGSGVIALTVHFMMTGIDDDVEGWSQEPASLLEEDPWEGDDTAQYAESLLQSFLHSLGSAALTVALPLIETLLSPNPQADWRRQCAGLAAMEACMSFVPVSFAPHIPIATEAALSLATPTQPIRVRWQALRLLGVLCETNVKSTMESSYSVRILQTLAQAVQSPCTKVSALACLALVSFCRGGAFGGNENDDSPHPLVAFLPDLLSALTKGPLSRQIGTSADCGVAVVQIRAVGAVACLAQTSGEAFVPFYGSVMPGLLAISQIQHDGKSHETTQLLGAAIEAATIVGQAIESDEATRSNYVKDAEQIMNFILPILQRHGQGGIMSEMPMDQMLSACARIATVLGSDYVRFVPMVLPHLLKRATAPPDLSVTEGDEAGLDATKRNEIEIDEDMGTESITVATPGKGIQKFTINTSQIQEKSQSARAVYEHAVALGASFAPFVEQSMNAFVPLINFQFSPEVRSTSAQACASIFEAACLAADDSATEAKRLQQLFPVLVKVLAKQIHGESPMEQEVLFALADALSEVFYSSYQRKDSYGRLIVSTLSLEEAAETVELTMNSISSCLKRRSKIYKVLSGQDGSVGEDEREECQAQLKEEEQLLTPLVDSVGYTIKFYKESFIPVFDKSVAPVLCPSLTNGDIRARLCAVCLYDDCVEHCCGSAATAKHAEKLVYGILLGIDSNCNGGDMDLLSASIYGVSQICRYAPSTVLEPHLQSIFHHLMAVIKSTSKEETDSPMVYENAVSALASMVLIGSSPFANSGFVKPEDVLPLFLGNLPLREDPDEAKICHAGFCDLVDNGSINLSAKNATKALEVIGEVLAFVSEGEDIASQDTCSRLAGILVKMQHQLPADQMNAAFTSISLEAQNGINLAMQG